MNGFADGALLRDQPGIFGFLPDIHGTAHDPELVVAGERGNRLARVELDGIPGNAVFLQELAEDRRMLDGDMLEDEDSHEPKFATTDAARSRGSRPIPIPDRKSVQRQAAFGLFSTAGVRARQ